LEGETTDGQFAREIDGSIDVSQQWKWLNNSNLKKETEGLIMAAQNQAITTNCIKVKIFHQPGSAYITSVGVTWNRWIKS